MEVEWLSPIRDIYELVFPFLKSSPVLRAVLGIILLFFIPGFAWILLFFRNKQIHWIERIALSIGLSIAIVTLSIMAMNIAAGVSVRGFNSVLIIIVVIVIPLAVYGILRLRKKIESGI